MKLLKKWLPPGPSLRLALALSATFFWNIVEEYYDRILLLEKSLLHDEWQEMHRFYAWCPISGTGTTGIVLCRFLSKSVNVIMPRDSRKNWTDKALIGLDKHLVEALYSLGVQKRYGR